MSDIRSAPPKPRGRWRPITAFLVIAAITVWSAIGVNANFGAIIENWNNASGTISSLLRPDYWFLPGTIQAVVETVQMAVIAIAIGAAVSLPMAFLASRTTNPSGGLQSAARFVMNLVRSVPNLLYAAVLVSVVGTGALSGIIALILFDIGIIVKLVSESIDGLDVGAQEAALSAGGSWFKADRTAMLPQAMPAYTSHVLYVFELNIRASTVIGLVGAGGLGMLIDRVRTFYRYHDLSLIILEILVIVIIIESASSLLRKRLAR